MQIYDIAIAPGVPRQLDAVGDYFYFYSGNAGGADSSIKLQGRASGLQIMLMPGQSYKLPPGTSETTWIMTNRVGGGTIIGSVIIGNGGIDDNRVTGSVEVIDGGLNRTLGNGAFASSKGLTPATSTNNVGIQIFNNGSTKNVIVEQVQVMSNAASGVFILRVDNVALGSPVAAVSKLAGGADSAIANLRSQEGTVWSGKTIAQIGWNTAFQNVAFTPKEPIVLPPGYGLSVTDGIVVAHSSWVNFEHYEQ